MKFDYKLRHGRRRCSQCKVLTSFLKNARRIDPLRIGEAMHLNPLFVPTLIGSAAWFWLGLVLEKKVHASRGRAVLWMSALVLASPGLLFVLYYAHIFDHAAWFYSLRTVLYTELLGCGLGLAAGVVQSWWEPEDFGERMVAPAVLFVLVLVPFVKPLLDPIDMGQLKDRCEGEVCLQYVFHLWPSQRRHAAKDIRENRVRERTGT